jgi:hypothetical protein
LAEVGRSPLLPARDRMRACIFLIWLWSRFIQAVKFARGDDHHYCLHETGHVPASSFWHLCKSGVSCKIGEKWTNPTAACMIQDTRHACFLTCLGKKHSILHEFQMWEHHCRCPCKIVIHACISYFVLVLVSMKSAGAWDSHCTERALPMLA